MGGAHRSLYRNGRDSGVSRDGGECPQMFKIFPPVCHALRHELQKARPVTPAVQATMFSCSVPRRRRTPVSLETKLFKHSYLAKFFKPQFQERLLLRWPQIGKNVDILVQGTAYVKYLPISRLRRHLNDVFKICTPAANISSSYTLTQTGGNIGSSNLFTEPIWLNNSHYFDGQNSPFLLSFLPLAWELCNSFV